MSERNARLLLDDILTAIEKIQIYTAGYTFEEYIADDKTINDLKIAIAALLKEEG